MMENLSLMGSISSSLSLGINSLCMCRQDGSSRFCSWVILLRSRVSWLVSYLYQTSIQSDPSFLHIDLNISGNLECNILQILLHRDQNFLEELKWNCLFHFVSHLERFIQLVLHESEALKVRVSWNTRVGFGVIFFIIYSRLVKKGNLSCLVVDKVFDVGFEESDDKFFLALNFLPPILIELINAWCDDCCKLDAVLELCIPLLKGSQSLHFLWLQNIEIKTLLRV